MGLLGRLTVRSQLLSRIGKEVDRLDEDEGIPLEPDQPVEYEGDDLAEDIAFLATSPQELVAERLGLSSRRWRDVLKALQPAKMATLNTLKAYEADLEVSCETAPSILCEVHRQTRAAGAASGPCLLLPIDRLDVISG
jgi:hypothetical protein